jgi:hypothetical protein
MSKTKTFLVNGALVLVTTALGVLAALALDRWLDLGLRRALGTVLVTNVQQPEPIMYIYDNRTGWRLNPFTQYHRSRTGPFMAYAGIQPYDTRLRVNSDGFIDREHFLEKSRYRIAFVGNSWVEAVQQEFTGRFSLLTEDYVFERSEHRRLVEVMNFGVSNAAPAQAYGVIKSFVLKYRPDEVWLFLTSADVRANTPIDTPPPFGPSFEYADAAHTRLKDIRFGYVDPPAYAAWKRQQELGKYLGAVKDFSEIMPYFYSDEHSLVSDRVWEDMRLSIALIKRTLDEQGIRMRAVFIPDITEVDPAAWKQYRARAVKAVGRDLPMDPERGERRYAKLAADLGIEFVSLLPLCKENGAAEMIADHFTSAGHRRVAGYLAKLIIDTTPVRQTSVEAAPAKSN